MIEQQQSLNSKKSIEPLGSFLLFLYEHYINKQIVFQDQFSRTGNMNYKRKLNQSMQFNFFAIKYVFKCSYKYNNNM